MNTHTTTETLGEEKNIFSQRKSLHNNQQSVLRMRSTGSKINIFVKIAVYFH